MGEFYMPSLGADMETGVLIEWEVEPGARVKRGDVMATIGTEKGDIAVEVFEDGIVQELLIEEGTEVPVGTVLARIQSETGEAVPAAAPVAKRRISATKAAVAVETLDGTDTEPHPMDQRALVESPPQPQAQRIRISPVARNMAAELGIDLGRVAGSGPQGAINRADIERAYAEQKPQADTPVIDKPSLAKPAPPAASQTGMRKAIARAMARSNREIPHYYLETKIDMTHCLTWLEQENLQRSIEQRLLPAVLLIKAVALALTDVPELNGYWMDGRLQIQENIHIGFAIALRTGGLITPAIRHADLKSLDELMQDVRDLIVRTRENRLRSSELTDATVTVTNLGDLGVETVYGVIYPPQVALVGVGRITEQPWADNGMLGVRRVITATLAADHRATDGRTGGRFLSALNAYLQEVETL